MRCFALLAQRCANTLAPRGLASHMRGLLAPVRWASKTLIVAIGLRLSLAALYPGVVPNSGCHQDLPSKACHQGMPLNGCAACATGCRNHARSFPSAAASRRLSSANRRRDKPPDKVTPRARVLLRPRSHQRFASRHGTWPWVWLHTAVTFSSNILTVAVPRGKVRRSGYP